MAARMFHQPFDALRDGFAVGIHRELYTGIVPERQGRPFPKNMIKSVRGETVEPRTDNSSTINGISVHPSTSLP
jgi:hypothetical protein